MVASSASPIVMRRLTAVDPRTAIRGHVRQLHILYMILIPMMLFRQRRPKRTKWREGPAQPFEKARFAEGKSLDFSSPGLDFSSLRLGFSFPWLGFSFPPFAQTENSAAPRNSMNNNLNSMTRVESSSGWGDDGRSAATDEANIQNLPRDRRPEPSGEMQRRAVAYRRHHGIGKRGVVGPAAARPYEDDLRLTYDGAFTREADANRDLIVIVRRTPAGGEPCRAAMDAGDRRRRFGGLRSRPRASATIPIEAKRRTV